MNWKLPFLVKKQHAFPQASRNHLTAKKAITDTSLMDSCLPWMNTILNMNVL